jgi:tetratricopeptide (TPR) repeat protein
MVVVGLLTACRPESSVDPSSAASAETAAAGEVGRDAEAGAPDMPGGEDAMRSSGPRERPALTEVHSRDEAMAAVAGGQPEAAISFLGAHVEKNADDQEAVIELARAHRVVGALDEAAKLLTGLEGKLGSSTRECEILRLRADLAELRGDLGSAETLIESALKLEPDDLANRGRMVALLHATGRADEARARELIDSLYDAYGADRVKTPADMLAVARGTLATGSHGGFKDANMVLTEAEEIEQAAKGSALADEILLLHAEVFRRKYAADAAAETLQFIFQRDAFQPDALVLLGHVQIDGLQLANASHSAEEALLTNPHHPGAHALLARIALVEGRRVEARERVEAQVLAVNPHHTEGLAVLAAIALFDSDARGYADARDRATKDNAKNADFYVQLADALGFLHLYVESDEILREGIARVGERDPFLQSAFGLNALRLGHEEEGRQAIERAWKRDRSNERTLNTRKLYSDRIEPAYSDERHGDLTLRVPKEGEAFARDGFAEAIGRARKQLDQAYGVHPTPMRIEIFDEPDDFSIRTVGVPSLGALAVCFGRVITVMGPYRGHINFDQVIWHELSHTYAIQISRGRVPRWFTEGLSEWESEVADPAWARESARLLAEARRRGKTRKLHELELAFLRAESPVMMEVAYATAAYAMRFLGSTYGRPKLIRMLEGYGKGKTTESLFVEVLGKDMAAIEKEFEAWFGQELERRVGGWMPQATVDGDTVVSEKGAAAGKGDERDELFQAAMEAMKNKDAEAASRKLEALIAKGGDGYPTRFALARVLMEGPGRKNAVKHLEKAAEFNSEATEPFAMLAVLANEAGDLDAEKKALHGALRIDAMTVDPAGRLLMLAMVSKDGKRRDYALARLRALAPLHPATLAGQAAVLGASKKKAERERGQAMLEEASRVLAKAQGKGPADTYVVAALAAAALGDGERQKAMAKRALGAGVLPDAAKKRMEKLSR